MGTSGSPFILQAPSDTTAASPGVQATNARKKLSPMAEPQAAASGTTPWGVVLKPVARISGSNAQPTTDTNTSSSNVSLEMSPLGPDSDLKMAQPRTGAVKRPTFGKSVVKKDYQVSCL
jgi:hypothetical protein